MQIETVRKRLEEFEQKLDRELYHYFSGRKDRLELTPVYSEYSDLFSLDTIREAESELKSTAESFESRRKSWGRIIAFLTDQHFELQLARLNEELAALESIRSVSRLRSEPDADERRKLAGLQADALAETEEIRLRYFERLQSVAARLGFANYARAREGISGIDYATLLNSFEEVLSLVEEEFAGRFRVSLETSLGISCAEAGVWDTAFWQTRNDRPEFFPARNLLPFVDTILSELNIRPEKPEVISVDLEQKGRDSRPCCIPVRIPDEIRIVMPSGEGSRHYAALLHEYGHACHFAWTSPSLPVETRVWGDKALSEGYAFLLENIVFEPQILARLRFAEPKQFLQFQVLHRIYLVRRSVGKTRFALKLFADGPSDAPHIYSELMTSATGLRHNPQAWLGDFMDAFESADYLRGWALEAVLREYLRTRYGKGWISSRQASGFLKEIWETGQLYGADELCRELGFGGLAPRILAERLLEELIS